MNRKGAGTNLTWIFISIAAFIAVIILATQAYTTFANDNSVLIDPTYNSYYNSLASENGTLSTFATNASLSGTVLGVWNAGVNTFTTAVIGVQAITMFLNFPGMLLSMGNQILTGLNLGTAGVILFWFITVAVTIYITMKIIKAIRGTLEEP